MLPPAWGMEDVEYAPFHEGGEVMRAYKLFGQELGGILNELNDALAG